MLLALTLAACGLLPETPPPPPTAPVPADVPPTKSASLVGPALERVRARGELLVGIDTGEPPGVGTPPMYVVDAAGAPDGFDYRVAQKIAETIGVPKVKVVHGKYSELPAMLVEKPQFDVLISGYVPTEEPGIAWSDAYLEFGLCLVVPSASPVKTVQDLWGKPVGIFDDDAAAEEVQRLVKGYTELVRLEDGYWEALLDGRYAGFIYDYPYAAAEIREWYDDHPEKKGAFRFAQYNLTDSTYAVGVRKTEPELLGAVNEAIRGFRASDAYGEAVRTWLSGGAPVAQEAVAGARMYVVQAGDTLSGIAGRELGSIDRWKELWALNKERFPNPNLIDVGDEVRLPS